MIDSFYWRAPEIQPFQVDGRWRWLNVNDLSISIQLGTGSFMATVPAGFTTDGASIPGWAQRLFLFNPYEPAVIAAALVHDWLTPTDEEIANHLDEYSTRPMFPQTIAAGVFYELMRVAGVSMLRRRVYYYAVVAAIKRRFW